MRIRDWIREYTKATAAWRAADDDAKRAEDALKIALQRAQELSRLRNDARAAMMAEIEKGGEL